MNYVSLSSDEIGKFEEMFLTFKDLILSMIRNAVVALPDNLNDFKPSVNMHLKINKSDKYRYEDFMNVKDVFLSCIPNKKNRRFLKNTISYIAFDNKKRLKFFIKNKIYKNFDKDSVCCFRSDIKKLEKIINYINDDFNNCLPEAKKQRVLVLKKINKINKIPQKAKYIEDTNEENKIINLT